jgi:RNA polymerase sigma-70 factor (ECF subfamily)
MHKKRDNTFDKMLIKTLPTLHQYALYLTRNLAESEDLINNVALRCLERHQQFTIGSNFRSWASRIMYTTHVDSVRRSNRRVTYRLGDDHDTTNNDDPSSTQLILELKAGLQKLPSSSRRIIIHVANGEKYDRVAQIENLPVGTVRSRLSRGRATLREYCDRESV